MSIKHSITALLYDKRGKLLSIGRNSYVKTHPLQAKAAALVGQSSRIFLHAEVDAVVKCKDWSKAYRMVITRFNKQGEACLAKPCEVCQHVIKLVGINHVEHT